METLSAILKLGLTLIATCTSPYCSRYNSLGDDKENLFNNQELSMVGNHFLYLYDLTVWCGNVIGRRN